MPYSLKPWSKFLQSILFIISIAPHRTECIKQSHDEKLIKTNFSDIKIDVQVKYEVSLNQAHPCLDSRTIKDRKASRGEI